MADVIEGLRAASRLGPGDAERMFSLGIDACNAGLDEQALPFIAAAARKAGTDPRLWHLEALMHRALDDLEPSVAAFKRAAALVPSNVKVVHGLARASLEAGLPSVDLFRAAHRLSPYDGDILLGLAAALFADEGPQAAIDELDGHLRRHSSWLDGHDQIARLRWMMGDRGGFTASIEHAIAAAPRDIELWRLLISVRMHAELYEEALSVIARARAAAGPHIAFDVNEAVCVAELGDIGQADRLFARLAGLNDPTLIVRHVRHLLRAGRPEEAAKRGEPLTRAPGADLVWPYMAAAWRLLGDPRWEWLEGDPRFVGIYDLSDKIPSLMALADRLRALHVATHQPLEQSVRGGTQTDGALFSRIEPEIRALRKAIVEAVETHVAQLPPRQAGHPLLEKARGPIRFSGSWSVRLTGAGHHANHIHPAGWFSSALYVALPSEEERGPAPAGWLTLGEPQKELGLDLPPFRTIEPRPGRLVLFPSTMWHGTRPFDTGERLTVAFDVAPPSG